MDEWISKKDLLNETGISYGQLYRWKREGLIPDAWFEKRSSFTGQETFFTRKLILERIHFILTHKDEYSLSELKGLLTPKTNSRIYPIDDIKMLPAAERSAALYESLTGTMYVNHGQALTIILSAAYDEQCRPTDEELTNFLTTICAWQAERDIFSLSEGRLFVIRVPGAVIPLLFTSEGDIYLPEGAEILHCISMNEVARTYNRMLNRIYRIK